ncbi:uncharacterized protein LOC135169320 [Diachasmimorpha longicaudata]|uniref:uncharacterized protein LOC135169320 n=1 Tax=Diachasmimorpha longicaudata TaxID=58733 RepID=UPI0030B8A2A5
MVNSVTNSTLKQYNCSLKHWWDYVYKNNLDIHDTNSLKIIAFLTFKLRMRASYSTLNTARSAIYLISISDSNRDGLISRFMKGVFKQKPTPPRYTTTWDVTPVLEYLNKLYPLKDLKLKDAAEKVITLLALTTAQRFQTLSVINIDNISISDTSISIKITDPLKTSCPRSFQPDLILPFFREKPGLCVASAILDYINITKELRDPEMKKLFMTTKKPFTEHQTRCSVCCSSKRR